MTPDEIEKDRGQGTPGKWLDRWDGEGGAFVIGDTTVIAHMAGPKTRVKANARRIARLPDLEQAYLDLTAENAALKQRIAELVAINNDEDEECFVPSKEDRSK